MSADGYGLGIDIGNSTITVAACTPDDARCAEPLHLLEAPADGRIGALLDRVGDPVPLYVDGRPVPAADAVAATIAEVVEQVAAQLGVPAAWTVVTVPPSWTEHRRSALTAALADALHGTATLTSSAIAVARHGRATGTVPAAATVAVYDLGASTLDTAVVRVGQDGAIAHLAPPPSPLPWGGRDVDDAVVGHVRGFLPAAPTTLRAACVAAKEALSTQTDVRIEVGGRTRPIRLVREDLDELLADAVAESVDALRGAVTGAGLDPSQLDGVVLAGGSARLPAVAEALSAELGRPVLVTAEPELAAACGAAELALDLLEAPAEPTVELAAVVVDPDEDELSVDDEESYDEYDADPDDELGERRRRRRSLGTAALSRVALVAALFVVILAAPVTLLAALDSSVLATHGGSTASAADSPAAQTPAPDSPAAATGPAGATSVAAHETSTSSRRSTKATSASSRATGAVRSTAAGSTAAAAAAAASSSTAAPVGQVAPVLPVDTTTVTTDPGTTTPAPPPVTEPPVTNPPVTDPPVTNPPVTDPPVTNPPVADPPPSTDPAPPAGDAAPPAADPGAATQAAA